MNAFNKLGLKGFLLIVILLITACAPKKVEPIHYDKYSLKLEIEGSDKVEEIVYSDKNQSAHQNELSFIDKPLSVVEDVPTFIKAGKLPRRMGQKKKNFLKEPNKKLKISVENIPINKFIHLVFGEVFKLNYSVSETLEKRKDKVTMRMDDKVTAIELYSVIEGILKNYKIQVENKNGVLFVSSGNQVSKQKLDYKISFGKTIQYRNIPENEMIFQILPIDYIGLAKARDILQEFALSKTGSRVYNMRGNNALLIKDFASNIRRGLGLLATLDKPYLREKIFKLIRLEHISVKKFDAQLKKVFKVLNINVASNIQGEPITTLMIEDINALFVITDKPELIKTILYWKSKLDNLAELENNKQLFVYHTKNRAAKEVKEILDEVMSSASDIKKKQKVPNSDGVLIKSNLAVAGKNKKSTSALPKETKVTLDEARNNLIFYMLPSEYKKVHSLLSTIDTRAQQILIEVTIAEISLKDNLQYGVEWALQTGGRSATTVGGTAGALNLGGGGLSGIITGTNVQVVFNALAQENLLSILSSPKLVVLNNETASFTAGTQVPIITSQTSAPDLGTGIGGPSVLQNVTYVNTGVTTSIQPTITADDSIILNISQTVSEAQNNNTSDISSPIIIQRSLQTVVVLKHGEELVLGGLIRENESESVSKVPILGDIPWIGELFKTYSVGLDKTELVFVVKPYILDRVKKSDSILKAFSALTDIQK
ncbi:hypothetical protein JHD50_10620 [Sulfurimonas sp. MAG313]|nr:secretin N-terminal domain-containing protein [Sulfurimonas sp. MAG313]MDF1881745.1 hypothetical protein [Sulfurimonas sp. MAG313]